MTAQPTQREEDGYGQPNTCNNGFWDRPAEERAARMDAACERGGVESFWDLSPEERGRTYDS